MFKKQFRRSNGHYLKQKPDTGIKLVLPFLATLAVLTVVSFIIPLRPTISQIEKRELAKFPEFSWEALAEGDYFDQISTWYSDTFPGRERWLSLATNIESLHGNAEVVIAGALPIMEEIPPVTQPQPARMPEPQPEQPQKQPAPEAVATEATEPEPTQWQGVDAGEQAIIDISDTAIIQIGDSAFNALGFSEIGSNRYATAVGTLADAMKEEGVRVVSAPAPTSVGVMIEPQYLEKLKCANQKEMLDYMHGLMSDNAIKVDTHAAMTAHMDEYIYFRTDHHWTARGAYYVYEAVCNALGNTPTPLEEFREWDMGEFHGSLSGKVSRPHKLRWDNLYAYVTDDDVVMTIYTNNKYSKGVEWPMIQDMSKRGKDEKYSAFLRNDNPLTTLVNNDLPEGTSCVLVKDSFGNCLAPYLTQNYHTVYVVDYRKYNATSLRQLVQEHGVQDVIFAPYMIATQSLAGGDLFTRLCRLEGA